MNKLVNYFFFNNIEGKISSGKEWGDYIIETEDYGTFHCDSRGNVTHSTYGYSVEYAEDEIDVLIDKLKKMGV